MLGRILAVVLSMLLLWSAAADAERYLWTLSASDTDPYANIAEPSLGIFEIHLWLACSTEGMSAAEFFVEDTTGNLVLLAWTPCCGFLLNGPGPCPFLAVGGCPSGPQRAGWFTVLDPTGQGGSVCILPCPATGANYTVDCSATPEAHPNAWIGFSNNGTPPCSGGECGPISVNDESWGRVKSLYQ
jgi:hypothetical protein